jgi:hypothetical protein
LSELDAVSIPPFILERIGGQAARTGSSRAYPIRVRHRHSPGLAFVAVERPAAALGVVATGSRDRSSDV